MLKSCLPSFKQRLSSQTGFLFFATISGYAFSYFYLLAMGRILLPEVYGVLGALFAIFYITCLFGQALMEAIATRVAEIKVKAGEPVAIKIFVKLALKLSLLSLLPAVILMIVSQPVASFFHVNGVNPVIILAVALCAALILHIVLGLLQGLQEFKYLGITGYFAAQGLKLVLGVLFVLVGWGLAGAIGALFASVAIAAALGFLLVLKRLTGNARPRERYESRLGSVIAPAFILAVFMAVPASVDVMLVTHYFGGREAGLYNAVATIGKVIVFLPMAVSFILLPRVTEIHAQGKRSAHILFQSLLLTLFLSGIVAIIYWGFADIIVRIFFGEPYAGAGDILRFYAAAMLLFSLNVVLMHYSLAIRKMWLMALVDFITLVEVLAVIMIHRNIEEIIWILLSGNILIFITSLPVLIFIRAQNGVIGFGSLLKAALSRGGPAQYGETIKEGYSKETDEEGGK